MSHKLGVLRNDDDGHWYLIPEDLAHEFDSTEETIYMADAYSEYWNSAIEHFEKEFGRYRLPGGYRELKVLMEE